jgi:hypothetical protein
MRKIGLMEEVNRVTFDTYHKMLAAVSAAADNKMASHVDDLTRGIVDGEVFVSTRHTTYLALGMLVR